MHSLAGEQVNGGHVDFSRKPEEDDWDVIAFDAQGEYFAAADDWGKVAIFSFRPPQYPKSAQAIIQQPDRLGIRPLALAFSPQRQWLAMVRGNGLTVWNLQSLNYPRELESAVGKTWSPTAGLAFNPDGDLLAVGSANGWQMWNVKGRQLLAQGPEPVYTVAFSQDGRLFAWGDTNGTVHVWGLR